MVALASLGSIALVLTLIVCQASASAATVSVENGTLTYTAAPGEANYVNLYVDPDPAADVLVRDDGVVLTPGPNCVGISANEALCSSAFSFASIDLGDQDDAAFLGEVPVPMSIRGGDGRDYLGGGAQGDLIDGGAGEDTLTSSVSGFLGGGPDVLHGGPGNDSLGGDSDTDLLEGDSGNDTLGGGGTLNGGPGDDIAYPGGQTTFSGGEDRDTVVYGGDEPLSITLDGQPDDGTAGQHDNILPDVEVVTGSRKGDILVGSDGDNSLDGGGGDDLIVGLGGNDVLQGGVRDLGSDTLQGGAGADSLQGNSGDDLLDGGDGDDTMSGGAGSDSMEGAGGSDAMEGGAAGDVIAGGPGDDVLRGGAALLIGADGADELDGGEGNDSLSGEAGRDLLDGGRGADLLSGGRDDDVVAYGVRTSPLSVTLDGLGNDGEAGEHDNVGSDIEEARGGGSRDDLIGDFRANALSGREGEDYIDGGAGADRLDGGSDSDFIRTRDGNPDQVTCGDGNDFAVVDPTDTTIRCERVDTGVNTQPVLGDSVTARPQGTVPLQLPGVGRFVPLQDKVNLPVGSTLDATQSAIKLSAAGARKKSGGKAKRAKQRARLQGGEFTVSQRRSRRPVTELRLRGGSFRACAQAGARRSSSGALRARKRKRIRRLFGTSHGHFEVSGRHSATTVRGTVWSVEDRCDGTLTTVERGSVVVYDFARKQRVTVSAGESYLARAP